MTIFPNELNYGLVNQNIEIKLMEKTQIFDQPALLIFYGETLN